MKIGFDIDGTLSDFYRFVAAHGPAYLNKRGLPVQVNPDGYDLDEYFSLQDVLLAREHSKDQALAESRRLMHDFWNKAYLAYLRAPFIQPVVQAVREAAAQGHEVHIISSRRGAKEPGIKGVFVRRSIAWQLKHNGVPCHHLTLCEDDDKKLEAVRDSGVSLFVEDKARMAEGIADFALCIALSRPYNRQLKQTDSLFICQSDHTLPTLVAKRLKTPATAMATKK